MHNFKPLTDEEWAAVDPLFPKPLKRTRGKPHIAWRRVLNSILFVLTTGNKWSSLPIAPEFATKSASHRWFIIWDKNGHLDLILNTLKEKTKTVDDVVPPTRRQRTRAVRETLFRVHSEPESALALS
jgi:transposase